MAWRNKLREILLKWDGTPYVDGQAVAGEGANCVGSASGVACELEGVPPIEFERLPSDTAMHRPDTARAAMHRLMRLHPRWKRMVAPRSAQPGDMLVVGHGAPGHLMIVGAHPNTLAHCVRPRFCITGMALPSGMSLHALYRLEGI